jgi:hypothetical protein
MFITLNSVFVSECKRIYSDLFLCFIITLYALYMLYIYCFLLLIYVDTSVPIFRHIQRDVLERIV